METPQEYHQRRLEKPHSASELFWGICAIVGSSLIIGYPIMWISDWVEGSRFVQSVLGTTIYALLLGFTTYWFVKKYRKTRSISSTLFAPPALGVIAFILLLIFWVLITFFASLFFHRG